MQQTKIFLCVDVDTIYGYYQSRFGSLGPSYKGVPIPLKAQNFYTSHSGWVQIKFIFVAYEMSNTFLDHMQLDLGRYLLPFGRARQINFEQIYTIFLSLFWRLPSHGRSNSLVAQTKNWQFHSHTFVTVLPYILDFENLSKSITRKIMVVGI